MAGNKKENALPSPPKQPLSSFTYALISLLAFAAGTGLLLLYIFKAKDLIAQGIDKNVFYVLLLPLGFSTAAFLFGGMNSYAVYKEKAIGGTLKIGGPVVIFLLVVMGGFKLVPDTSTFALTVYAHGNKGKQDIVLKNTGEVIIDLETERLVKMIREYGEAYFPSIPARFRNQKIPITVIAKGFELANPDRKNVLSGNRIYVEVKRDSSLAQVSGVITNTEYHFLSDVQVRIGDLKTKTNENGIFILEIPPASQKEQQTLTIYKEGYQMWEDFVYPESGQVDVVLNKK